MGIGDEMSDAWKRGDWRGALAKGAARMKQVALDMTDLEVKAEKGRPTTVTISGADKQRVGQLAAMIRSKRPPTPYADNKGVRYRGEVIRKKAGKAFGDKK